MKVNAFGVLFFFICLNLSCYVLNEIEAVPYYMEGVETPESIKDITYTRVLSSISILVGGTLVGILFNTLVYGATIALIICVINLIFPVVDWLILGFPNLLLQMGVPEVIYTVIGTLFAAVWFWFLLGIIAQRYME